MFSGIGNRGALKSAWLTLCWLLALSLPAAAAPGRGSPSPSAPVQLVYALPEQIPAGSRFTLNLTVTTPLEQGELLMEVAAQEGVSVTGGALARVDLTTAQRPLELAVQALAGSAAERYLVVQVTVHTELGPLSRSFRIALPDAVPAAPVEHDTEGAEQGIKLLPAD